MDADDLAKVWNGIDKLARRAGDPKDLVSVLSARGSQHSYAKASSEHEWLVQATPSMPALPRMVLDRYQQQPRYCFFNVLPEIGRCWASIDNCLYLWPLGEKDAVPTVYKLEEQLITCVGLAPAKPGVFMAAVKHVLVVCTNVEVVLLGVCFSGDNPSHQMTLMSLAGYTVQTDAVQMCACAATAAGRVYLGAADGHIYEVDYGKRGRCRKVSVTATFLSAVAAVVPRMLTRHAPSAVASLVCDHERHYLYALLRNNAIVAFHMGEDGGMAPQKVVELPALPTATSSSARGENRRGGGAPKAPQIERLAVLPVATSKKAHLVAITADAKRVFLFLDTKRRALKAVHVVVSDGLVSGGAGRGALVVTGGGGRGVRPVSAGSALVCAYGSSTLLLAERGTADGALSQLLAALPNPAAAQSATPPLYGAAAGARVAPEATELVADAAAYIPGEIKVIEELPQASPFSPLLAKGLADEALRQLWLPPPRFAVMSTSGVLTVARRRPLEVLKSLLEKGSPTALQTFFQQVGPAEAACICLAIACPSTNPDTSHAVVARAEALLADSRYVGAPAWPAEGAAAAQTAAVVTEQSAPDWSELHKGAALLLFRVLDKVWKTPLLRLRPGGGGGGGGGSAASAAGVAALTFPPDALHALQRQLQEVAAAVTRAAERLRQHLASRGGGGTGGGVFGGVGLLQAPSPAQMPRRESAVSIEGEHMAALSKLAATAAEALLLVRKLNSHNVTRLLKKPPAELKTALSHFCLSELLTPAGRERTTGLLTDLLKRHTRNGTLPDSFATELRHGCPTFFPYRQQQYLSAFRDFEAAGKPDAPREVAEAAALKFLEHAHADFVAAVELKDVAPLLEAMGVYEGLVKLCVAKADAKDASGRYLQPEGAAAAADREAHFAVLSSLACRLAAGAKPTAPAAAAGGPAPPESLRRLLAAATASEDAVLQHLLFRDLISAGHGAMLVATVPQSMALERHLLALGHDRPYVIPWAQLGRTPAEPLTHAQLQHTALLKDLYIARHELRRAVDVLTALGHAHVDTAVEAAARPDRVRCFESAVFHAKTLRDDGLASRLETEWWLALLQQELLVAVEARLEAAQREGGGGGAPVDTLRQKRQTLQLQSLSATEMFNGVAKELELWPSCVKIMKFARYDGAADLETVWDLLLKQAVEACGAAAAEPRLRAACTETQELATTLAPSRWFPVPQIMRRLLEIAAGTWPGAAGAAPDAGPAMIDACLSQSLQGDRSALVPVLQALLCSGSPLVATGGAPALAQSALAWDFACTLCQGHLASLEGKAHSSDAWYNVPVADNLGQALDALADAVRLLVCELEQRESFQGQAQRLRGLQEEAQRLRRRLQRAY